MHARAERVECVRDRRGSARFGLALLAGSLLTPGWADCHRDGFDGDARTCAGNCAAGAGKCRSTRAEDRQCNNASEDICVTFDSSITDVHVDRMGAEIGILERQPELPQFLSVRVGEAEFDGLLASGIRGTGIGQYTFIGWSKRKPGSPDIALLHHQYEGGGMQFGRRLQLESMTCTQGAGMRWRYTIEGDFQQCKVVTEFSFCDYAELPYPFLCSKPGQTIDEMILGCGSAAYRAFEMVAADAALFAGCHRRPDD
jgi:hypothetical protein